MKKLLLFTILISALVLSGCKKKQPDLYTQILERKQINVGVKEDTRPFGYTDEKGQLQGFDIDLANYIANSFDSELKVNFVPVTAANRILMLNSDKVDMIIATMSVTPKRMEVVKFSTPYYVAGQTFLVPAKSNIKSTTDLKDKKIIMVFGSTAEKNIRLILPDAKLIGYKSYNAAVEALKIGAADAMAADDTILFGILEKNPNFKMLPKRYTKEPYAIAVKKSPNAETLYLQINNTLGNMRNNGELDKIKRKWIKW